MSRAPRSCTERRRSSSTTVGGSSPDCRTTSSRAGYDSLAATSVPDVFEMSATTTDGEVMAVRHRELPIDGVQFHPESVLTPLGGELARNFLQGVRG